MQQTEQKLRIEKSINCSGKFVDARGIPLLKNEHYIVKNYDLDGDAPKQFIKAYFYEENSTIRKANPRTWNAYIAKTAEKWYPHESVIEFMINRIGKVLGLKMNGIKLIKINTQIRFLSRFFLKKDEKLIHGAEICGEHLGDLILAKEIADHKPTAREFFTFEFIKEAIRNVFPNDFEYLTYELVKMLCFDALAGNNDRHFYNWGIIGTSKKSIKKPTFAPIYDSARGLLWNLSDENIKSYYQTHNKGGNKVLKYIEEACPRISIDANKQANHFQLIDFIKRYNQDFKEIVNELASVKNEAMVLEMLKNEFYPFFISERCQLITLILKNRFKTIREQ